MNSIVLLGGGGHCRACIDVIELSGAMSVAGIVQPASHPVSESIGYPVIGEDEDLPRLFEQFSHGLVSVGQIKSPVKRIQLYELLIKIGFLRPSIISPLAYVSKRALVRDGTIVMHGAIVNANAQIDDNCIINSQALVEHDCIIRSHCHISTGARVNGGVTIGCGSFVGSGAILGEGIRIGSNVVIGAGQVVLKDVPPDTIVRGN